MVERSEVQWGTRAIPYLIRRSGRRETVSVAVEPSGRVVLTAPTQTTVSRLDRVVRDKAAWILPRVRRALPTPPEREFINGETCLYLGRQYRLRLMRKREVRPIVLRNGWLELPVPRGIAEHENAYVRAALIDWYKRLATARFATWAEPWQRKLRVSVESVAIADQAKRWGSCSRGKLRLNWRLIQAPRPLVDYVIAHEVVHVLYDGHGPKFWSTLGRVMPDYEARKTMLRALGPRLVW